MNDEKLLKVLLAPYVSEKTTSVDGQYVFEVAKHADKTLIKKAVERQFNVKVSSVRTVNSKGKERRFGRVIGRRRGFKKAYVTLAAGSAIEMAVGD